MKLRIYPPTPVSVQVPPIQYLDNGIPTAVEDNKGLPSLAMIYKNGTQVPVADSDSDPNDVVAVPVKITDVGGANINITAGDINVQTSDMGANFDSQRIGDGSGNYIKVESDGSINTNSDNTDVVTAIGEVKTELETINTVDFATEATLADVKTAVETLNLVDFATEATLDAINTKVDSLATIGKQDEIIDAIENIAFDKTGLATSAKQDTAYLKLTEIDLEIEDVNTNLGTINSSLSGIDTKIGSTNTALGGIDTKIGATNTKLTELDNAVDAMSAKLPASLGRKSDSASLSVALASIDYALLNTIFNIISAREEEALISVTTKIPSTSSIQTFTPPADAKRMVIINNAGATADSVRWVAGSQTPSNTEGALLVPSAQSPLLPAGEIKVIAMEGTADVSVAWFGY